MRSVTPQRVTAVERVLLYGFQTGRSELLRRHIEGLNQYVMPLLQESSPPVSVWIGGLASRRGDEALNIALARRRAVMVERFIHSRGAAVGFRHGVTAESFGESLSTGQSEDSEYYRSVLVLIYRGQHRQTRRELPAPELYPYNHFRIRLDRSVDGGEVVAVGAYTFMIDYDLSRAGSPPSDPVFYRLIGAGIGAGAPIGVSGGDPTNPTWNSFASPRLTTTRGFEGQARIASVSASLLIGAGHTTFRMGPSSMDDWIVFEPFETGGVSAAVGASVVHGPFYIVDE